MDERTSEPKADAYDGKLLRGARVNALGTAAKALHPLFLVLATRLYGPAAVGVYMLATAMVEIAASLVTGGLKDGIVVFAGRGDPERDPAHRVRVHRVLANAFVTGAIGCAVLAIGMVAVGEDGIQAVFSRDAVARDSGEQIAALLGIVVLALPCIAIAELSIAGTRALMIMEYDTAILGFAKPALLCVTAALALVVAPDAVGLAWAFLATHALLAVLGIWALARHFALVELARAVAGFRFDRSLFAYAVPQSLNTTLVNFMTNIDQLLLGYFGVAPATIAFYGTGARVIRNVRQAKLAFSGAFAPVVARLHAEKRLVELEEHAAMVARWSTTLAMPALLAIVGLRREILLVFDETYVHDSSFILLLAVPPALSCAFGLSGNLIAMTGHSRWNLANSIVMATVMVAAAVLWIPQWGLMGAAVATTAAAVVVTVLQVVEVKKLVGVGLALRLLYKPLVAGVVGAGVLWACELLSQTVLVHAIGTAAAVAAYVAILRTLGLDPRDRELLRVGRA